MLGTSVWIVGKNMSMSVANSRFTVVIVPP
jgi:hypothetical protein